MKTTLAILVLVVAMGCTENQRARQFGGTEKIDLKPNEILVNVTWKNDQMWILTQDTITHINYFREKSSYGIWEGEVIIGDTIK